MTRELRGAQFGLGHIEPKEQDQNMIKIGIWNKWLEDKNYEFGLKQKAVGAANKMKQIIHTE